MAGNLVPSYRWLRSFLSLEKLPQFIERYLAQLDTVLTKLQFLGEKFDSLILKGLSAIGKHALGRELSEAEKAKFVFFLHKVALLCLVAGYLIGYLAGR